jgi:hypothetical protein
MLLGAVRVGAVGARPEANRRAVRASLSLAAERAGRALGFATPAALDGSTEKP